MSTLTDNLTSSTTIISLLEDVYKYIIPSTASAVLEQAGIYGASAISQGEIPNTHMLGFYVHPCQTGDVMNIVNQDRRISLDDYLVVWFGVFGGILGVGLL